MEVLKLKISMLLKKVISIPIELFLVRPGEGEEFVYTPVEINATIHCAVNSTFLYWIVDEFNFDIEHTRAVLHSRGIFQTTNTSSDGVTTSHVIVFGNTEMNNNTRLCCRSLMELDLEEACTHLIIYGMEHAMPCVSF